MKVGILAAMLLAGVCSGPTPLTATVDAVTSTSAVVGGPVQLVVKVTNTGPLIPHLGLVFRTPDHWYERNKLIDMGGCSINADQSGFDCGDLQPSESKTFAMAATAIAPGTFHYELALRELVQPFAYVNDHTDGPDVQAWDETIAAS